MIKSLLNLLIVVLLSASAVNTYAASVLSIKAKADKGGLITPSGNVKVAAGGSVTFTISSKNPAQYELIDVRVNGQSQGPVTTYTFSNVVSKQNIAAKFRKKLYTQTVKNNDPSYGKLTPVGSVTSPYGKALKFTAKPVKGYKAVISVDGVIVAQGVANKPVKFALKVADEHVVAAFFYNDETPLNMQRVTAAVAEPKVTIPNNTIDSNVPVASKPADTAGNSNSGGLSNSGGNVSQPTTPGSNTGGTDFGVKLGWGIPQGRTNGDPLLLSDIVGYEVYFTSEDGSVADVVAVSGSSTASALVMVPAAGVYYFSIATVDKNGEKSEMSSPVEVAIN